MPQIFGSMKCGPYSKGLEASTYNTNDFCKEAEKESNQHIACCRILHENNCSSLNPPLSQQFRPRLSEKRVAVGSLHPPPLVSFHLGQGLSAALSLLLAQMVAGNCSSGRVWLLPNISLPFLLMSFLSLIIIYLSWS